MYSIILISISLFLGACAETSKTKAGPAGADGADGEDGQDGNDGKDGEDGEDGQDGQMVVYEDLDDDGWGDSATATVILVTSLEAFQADGYVKIDGDCDDGWAGTYPGAPEWCDDADNDCDGDIDENDVCDDGSDDTGDTEDHSHQACVTSVGTGLGEWELGYRTAAVDAQWVSEVSYEAYVSDPAAQNSGNWCFEFEGTWIEFQGWGENSTLYRNYLTGACPSARSMIVMEDDEHCSVIVIEVDGEYAVFNTDSDDGYISGSDFNLHWME